MCHSAFAPCVAEEFSAPGEALAKSPHLHLPQCLREVKHCCALENRVKQNLTLLREVCPVLGHFCLNPMVKSAENDGNWGGI